MTKRDRLLERLRALDPADPQTIDRMSLDADEIREGILSNAVDELSGRRRMHRRRVTTALVAAVAAAAVIVPLILLLPLSDDPQTPRPGHPGSPSPSVSPSPSGSLTAIVVEAPVAGATVSSPVQVRGTADVFEATVSIRIFDATNNTIAETSTMATCGTGCRGDYAVEVPYEVGGEQPGVIEVFEASAKDGSPIDVVRIPVTLVPGPPDPIAAAVEGPWTDAQGTPVADGIDGPLVLRMVQGPDHCGQTSMTFLYMAWPPGSEARNTDRSLADGRVRQYIRDPHGLLGSSSGVRFEPAAMLPDDAEDTGLRRGAWHLWVAQSDSSQAVYLVSAEPGEPAVERWPRARLGCD